tara:strand:+ start:3859 stop:4242 length:384 start_codon:yes stop_codon:yes gene_type:complete
MTCFWDGIIGSLNNQDYEVAGIRKANNRDFINQLKKKNKMTSSVSWQGNKLTEQEMKEHMEAIKDYNINGIGNGHLTSTCDSFLLLVCEVFKVNITHRYMNVNIIYKHDSGRKTLNFRSNRGHFTRG